MCAEAALAFHDAARTHAGHELSEWLADWRALSTGIDGLIAKLKPSS